MVVLALHAALDPTKVGGAGAGPCSLLSTPRPAPTFRPGHSTTGLGVVSRRARGTRVGPNSSPGGFSAARPSSLWRNGVDVALLSGTRFCRRTVGPAPSAQSWFFIAWVRPW